MALSRSFVYASLLALIYLALAQKCKLQFDGRIPRGFNLAGLDTTNSYFQNGNVIGKGSCVGQ
jgi:hypothetical protein